MKEITFDRFVRGLIAVAIAVAAFLLIDYLTPVLLPFTVAWLFAYLLYPLVKFLQYKCRLRNRVVSILTALLLVGGALYGVGWFIFPPMVEQFVNLSNLLHKYFTENPDGTFIIGQIKELWQQNIDNGNLKKMAESSSFSDILSTFFSGTFSVVGKTIDIVVSIVAGAIALLYMFFILLDYEWMTDNFIKIFPLKSRPFWQELLDEMTRNLNAYIRGQGFIAFCVGILFAIGFSIIDFPMAIGLGIFIGILNLVPYLQTIAIIPTLALAALKAANTGESFWMIALGALAVFVVVQVIQDLILTPRIMGRAMNLNPALLLLSLSIWGSLLGFVGLIIALPATTLLITYYKKYVTKEHI